MSVRKAPASKAAARKTATKPKRAVKPRAKGTKPSVWDKIIALGKQIPAEELKNFPTDGARNLEHYLYGAPKQG